MGIGVSTDTGVINKFVMFTGDRHGLVCTFSLRGGFSLTNCVAFAKFGTGGTDWIFLPIGDSSFFRYTVGFGATAKRRDLKFMSPMITANPVICKMGLTNEW